MMDVEAFEQLLDDLVAAGVFDESADGHIEPSERFRRDREAFRTKAARLDESEFVATVEAYGGDAESAADVDASVLGDAMAIFDAAERVDRERSFLAARALSRADLSGTAPEVPDGFVPIDGGEIESFVQRHSAAVLYFWREDCDPCDDVRADLEALLADGQIPEPVGLAAVYGPDSAELVREEYQVAAAPTTLFCKHGAVDSRILGASGYDAIRSEIATIAESLD